MLLTSPRIPEDDLKDKVLGATHSLQQAAWALPGGRGNRHDSCPVHCGLGRGRLLSAGWVREAAMPPGVIG